MEPSRTFALLVSIAMGVFLTAAPLAGQDPPDAQPPAVSSEAGAGTEVATGVASPSAAPDSQLGWLSQLLPGYFFEVRFLHLQLWQWIGLLVAVVLASILGLIVAAFLMRVARRMAQATTTISWDDRLVKAIAAPVRLLSTVWIFHALTVLLFLNPQASAFVTTLTQCLVVVSVAWLLLRTVDVIAWSIEERTRRQDPSGLHTLVPMGSRITKIFVMLLAVLSLIHQLGFNVAGLLAGLGVGGLAVALAAQKTLENLFGGITVIADRPVQVGQFCRVGEHTGVVEDIGLRSTRVRTLDRTLLTIPNAEFSTARIENYAERDSMRLLSTLQVGYDTTPDQVRYLLVELRQMLYSHPRTLPDPCRVRFVNFGAHSLDIEVNVYIDTQNWNEFLGIREDIFLRIMDIVEASGTYFAYPSQTLYLGRDAGRNLDRSEAAEQAVKSWRSENTIPLPEFPPQRIEELRGTLTFPTEGAYPPGTTAVTR